MKNKFGDFILLIILFVVILCITLIANYIFLKDFGIIKLFYAALVSSVICCALIIILYKYFIISNGYLLYKGKNKRRKRIRGATVAGRMLHLYNYPIFLYLSPQSAPVDSQLPCGSEAISPVPFQGLADALCFSPLKRSIDLLLLKEALLRPFDGLRGEVSGLNHIALTHDEGVLDDVFKLPDIAGKIVSHQ